MNRKGHTIPSRVREGWLIPLSGGLVILAAGIWAASRTVSSGDLWVALGCGRYILTHGVGRNDPFSFTSPAGAWVNQNWLSHVLFALIYRATGLPGLGLWRVAITVALVALTAASARALGASRFFAVLGALGMAHVGQWFIDTRPNLHTLLLTAVLVRWLVGLERRPHRRLWPPLLLAVLWANLHGGFLFGIIALGAATAVLMVLQLPRTRTVAAGPVLLLLAPVALALGAVSPYGITNLTHPLVVASGPAAAHWRNVLEWRTPYAAGALNDAGVRAFWRILAIGILVGLAAILWRKRLRIRTEGPGRSRNPSLLPIGGVALAGLLLSLTSRRFIPLFGAAAVPFLAVTLSRLMPPLRLPAVAYAIAACLVSGAVGWDIAQRLLLPNPLWPRSVGWSSRLIRADEQPREVVRYLLGSGASGRLFTQWTWAGYLLYSAPFDRDQPRYRIFIDGRAQAAYPVSVSEDYIALEEAGAAESPERAKALLDRYKIDICVLDRRDTGLTPLISRLWGWVAVYSDDKAMMVVRSTLLDALSAGPFPDEAIAEASAAVRIRTEGDLGVQKSREAFAHALASVRLRPTTTGVAEMSRLALLAPESIAADLRAQASAECDRILAGGIGAPLFDALAIRANTARCRSTLAQTSGDEMAARKWRAEALACSERGKRLVARYFP